MQYTLKGFSLSELMIAITILSIIGIGASQINFIKSGDSQKADSLANRFINITETARNYDLIGKGVTGTVINTKGWRVNIPVASAGLLSLSYKNNVGSWLPYNLLNFNLKSQESISQVDCLNLDGSVNETINTTSSFSINFENRITSIVGCTDTNVRIIEFTVKFKDIEKKLRFNSISGTIQRQN